MPAALMHSGLERAAAELGRREAVRFGEGHWSFAELEASAASLAYYLAGVGVGPGDRVALMMGNRPEFIVVVHAISKLGAAAVLLNPAWKTLEVGHALQVTSPCHAVGDAQTRTVLAEHLGGDRITDVTDIAPFGAPENPGRARPAPGGSPRDVDPAWDAVLVFSSGTTGLPKAARHTHESITWAIRHWRHALDLSAEDRFQVATPPSHILGLLNFLTAIDAGATVRLHPRFALEEVLQHIASERMTLEMAVAPIALAMANHPDLEQYDLSSLRYIMWGATPVTPSVAETVTRRTGVQWLAAYGATELPVIAANPVRDPAARRLDSAGLPLPGVQLRVVDLDTGAVRLPGEVGEIQARSPSLMAGYLPDAANAEAFAEGWYRTGDVGWLEPEGWVHISDRSKEMIKVKGFQVAPAEIEAVLHGHPAVLDCAVFGVVDEVGGEIPVAAVQLDPHHPVQAEELTQLVSDSLAHYKRLGEVVFVDSIPRLPSGKVLRRNLRDELTPLLAARTTG
jgi:acyl-CoA synthetase (AMP-forming)/AMP-acid ligase II